MIANLPERERVTAYDSQVKCQMYGRAKIGLLEARLVGAI